MQRQVKSGGGSPVQVAYLSDRLDVADGRPQKFGTQLTQKSGCDFDFAPLDDREKVEARRKDLKWPPLDEYKQLVHETSLPPGCAASKSSVARMPLIEWNDKESHLPAPPPSVPTAQE